MFNRDGFRCRYCGCGVEDGTELTVDHVIPVSKDGPTDLGNLVTACWPCNIGKSDREVERAPAQVGPPVTDTRRVEWLVVGILFKRGWVPLSDLCRMAALGEGKLEVVLYRLMKRRLVEREYRQAGESWFEPHYRLVL